MSMESFGVDATYIFLLLRKEQKFAIRNGLWNEHRSRIVFRNRCSYAFPLKISNVDDAQSRESVSRRGQLLELADFERMPNTNVLVICVIIIDTFTVGCKMG